MGTLLTQTEILYPKAAGAAVYTWRAEMPDGRTLHSTDEDVNGIAVAGRFATFEEAKLDAQETLHVWQSREAVLPREVLILRSQAETYALMRVG